MEVTVECQKRPEGSKPGALRREGLIPASLYGHKGAESDSLVIGAKNAENLLKAASVNNTLVDVNVPDLSWRGKALIREVQAHPWKRTLYHLSFFSVAAQASVEVVVPVHLIGEAAGTKEGGILEQVITELTVQCAPESIPESVDIDVTEMEIGTNLHVHELTIPNGVTVMDEQQRTVLSIVPPAIDAAAEEEAEAEAALIGTDEAEASEEAPAPSEAPEPSEAEA